MEPALERILIDRETIAARVAELAAELTTALESVDDAPVVILPVLTGSIVFVADLIRHLPGRFRVEVLVATSYVGATTTPTQAPELRALPSGIRGAHVVIVDDILDSGATLERVRTVVRAAQPASVRAAVLLRKRVDGQRRVACEHVGFEVDDVFVVGYGLDYDGYYRNLPDIGVLETEA